MNKTKAQIQSLDDAMANGNNIANIILAQSGVGKSKFSTHIKTLMYLNLQEQARAQAKGREDSFLHQELSFEMFDSGSAKYTFKGFDVDEHTAAVYWKNQCVVYYGNVWWCEAELMEDDKTPTVEALLNFLSVELNDII